MSTSIAGRTGSGDFVHVAVNDSGELLVSAPSSTPLTDAQLRATALLTTESVMDSTGQPFSPDACAHTYGYSAGLLVTDTATDGTSTWVKTYSYTSGDLTGETKWVRQ